jgi:hypothetical protein
MQNHQLRHPHHRSPVVHAAGSRVGRRQLRHPQAHAERQARDGCGGVGAHVRVSVVSTASAAVTSTHIPHTVQPSQQQSTAAPCKRAATAAAPHAHPPIHPQTQTAGPPYVSPVANEALIEVSVDIAEMVRATAVRVPLVCGAIECGCVMSECACVVSECVRVCCVGVEGGRDGERGRGRLGRDGDKPRGGRRAARPGVHRCGRRQRVAGYCEAEAPGRAARWKKTYHPPINSPRPMEHLFVAQLG